jgi:hypothetical protein
MKTTARVLITLECNRNCAECVNTKEMLSTAQKIKDIKCLAGYKEVCVTGGEPALCLYRVHDLVRRLKRQNPKQHVFLYTALYNVDLFNLNLIDLLDGVHFTLHTNTPKDLVDFYTFQTILEHRLFPNKSFRLFVSPKINGHITIIPSIWNKIEVKPWLADCPLPEHEDLFILEEKK